MTSPRPFLPMRIHLVTRRVTNRKFLLLPDETVKNACGYVLGEAQRRYPVGILAFDFQSNHYHCLILDMLGNASEFYQFLHTHLARALNTYRGRRENFWEAPAQTHLSPKFTPDEVLASILYVVLNPVNAGLVHKAHLWEGLISHTRRWRDDRERTFTRPGFYFDPLNWPETATVRLSKPPGFESLTDEAFHTKVRNLVTKEEERIQQEMQDQGRRFKGVRAIRRTNPNHRATSEPKPKVRKPRGPSHRKNWWDWLKRWREAYKEARELLLKGAEAVFPIGTYWLDRFVGVKVGQGPKPPPTPLNP